MVVIDRHLNSDHRVSHSICISKCRAHWHPTKSFPTHGTKCNVLRCRCAVADFQATFAGTLSRKFSTNCNEQMC